MKLETEQNRYHESFVVPFEKANTDFLMFTVLTDKGVYVCDFYWVGSTLQFPGDIQQPAIYVKKEKVTYPGKLTMCFDGNVNYIRGKDNLYFPDNGEVYNLDTDTFYFFNNADPMVAEKRYALKRNNQSFTMNNITLRTINLEVGFQMDLRATFTGDINLYDPKGNDELNNYSRVDILASLDQMYQFVRT